MKKTTSSSPKVKETEIVASYTGKISTGKWENLSPFFSLKEVWTGHLNDTFISSRQKELSMLCSQKFNELEKQERLERIQEEYKHIRFYPGNNGMQYPSVTSIIGWDKDFFISQEELIQYAARGTIIHKQIEIFLKTGEWKQPKDIIECHKEYVVVKKGSLSLSLDGYHIDEFKSKFKLDKYELETVSYNHEHQYAGRRDYKGLVDGKMSLIDWKTSDKIDEVYAFQQLAAHMMCPGNEDVVQVVAVPVTNKTEQGYSKPKIKSREETMQYWELFLKSRNDFKYRFGV